MSFRRCRFVVVVSSPFCSAPLFSLSLSRVHVVVVDIVAIVTVVAVVAAVAIVAAVAVVAVVSSLSFRRLSVLLHSFL